MQPQGLDTKVNDDPLSGLKGEFRERVVMARQKQADAQPSGEAGKKRQSRGSRMMHD